MENKQALNGEMFLVRWRSLTHLSFTQKWLQFLRDNVTTHQEICQLCEEMFLVPQTFYKWLLPERAHTLPAWATFAMSLRYLGVPDEVIEGPLRREYALVLKRTGRRTTEHRAAVQSAQAEKVTDQLKSPEHLHQMHY